eukprot:scaffold21439_cov129-Isochrysis_galbana.AAC.2
MSHAVSLILSLDARTGMLWDGRKEWFCHFSGTGSRTHCTLYCYLWIWCCHGHARDAHADDVPRLDGMRTNAPLWLVCLYVYMSIEGPSPLSSTRLTDAASASALDRIIRVLLGSCGARMCSDFGGP